jgi:hypothetical protein
MRQVLGGVVAAVVAIFLMWQEVPEIKRIWTDLGNRSDFYNSNKYIVLRYSCTNWNFFMWHKCNADYKEADKASVTLTGRKFDKEAGTLTDVRFGRAPEFRPTLLQLRADPGHLTTDISVDTAVHRAVLMGIFLICMVIFLLGSLVLIFAGFPRTPPKSA